VRACLYKERERKKRRKKWKPVSLERGGDPDITTDQFLIFLMQALFYCNDVDNCGL